MIILGVQRAFLNDLTWTEVCMTKTKPFGYQIDQAMFTTCCQEKNSPRQTQIATPPSSDPV